MLHTAKGFTADDCRDAFDLEPFRAKKDDRTTSRGSLTERPGTEEPEPAPPIGRYGEQRGFNVSAFALTVSLHVLGVALLLGIRQHVTYTEDAHLVAVNLSPPPPPPAAETPSQPEQPTTPVSPPPPLLKITRPKEANVPVPVDPKPAPPSPKPVKVSLAAQAPAPPAPISVVQGGDLGTRMVAGKPPRYPLASRRRKEQGTVVLSLALDLDGTVEHISVSRSSGFSRLDDAALDAVREWRWEPVMRDGRRMKVKGIVEIPFVLKGL